VRVEVAAGLEAAAAGQVEEVVSEDLAAAGAAAAAPVVDGKNCLYERVCY